MKNVRVFIASPMDVVEERRLAAGVVKRLTPEFAHHVDLHITFWEDEPLLASADFQSQIGDPADADIFVSVLWGRLGSPLGPQYKRADGSRYLSATEYEFEMAISSHHAKGTPKILVYRKEAPLPAGTDIKQVQALELFFDRWFLNSDQSAKAAYHAFTEPLRFEDTLEVHLRQLLAEYVPPPNNLPAETTPFIGRDELVSEIVALISEGEARLLTLVGPGGSGKTRTSVEASRHLLPKFRDGLFLIPLAAITDPDLVPAAIADVLEIREKTGSSVLQDVIQELKGKEILLLLDNFEQVQSGGGYLSEILKQCSGAKIIVTSREAIRLGGARTIRIPPLTLPHKDVDLPSLDEFLEYEAVRLFCERAVAVRQDFLLTENNAGTVVEICRRVDSLPLAIELAASRIRSMNPERLLSALEQRFRVLTGGSDDLLDHQRSLRTLIAWSYELLDAREQRLWRLLSIFPGGCTLDAAQQVCDPDHEFVVELDIESLVDKSLVNVRHEAPNTLPTSDDSPRISMLEMIREFAFEQLVDCDEFDGLNARFRDWCVMVAERGNIHGEGAALELNRIDEEEDNFRQALDVAKSGGTRVDIKFAVRLIGALWFYWYDRGIFSEAVDRLRWASEASYGENDELRGRVLKGLSVILRQQNQLEGATVAAEHCLRVYEDLGDERGCAGALIELGFISQRRGEYDAAERYLDRAIRLTREISGAQRDLSVCLVGRGVVDHLRGDLISARALYEEGLDIGREIADANDIGTALINLAEIAEADGQFEQAFDHCRESIRVFGLIRMKYSVAYCAEILGGLEVSKSRRPSEAAFLFGAASAMREELGTPVEPFNEKRLESALAQTREALSVDEFESAWNAGRALGLNGVLRHASSAGPNAKAAYSVGRPEREETG